LRVRHIFLPRSLSFYYQITLCATSSHSYSLFVLNKIISFAYILGRLVSMVAVRMHKLSYSHNYHNLFLTMVQTYSFDAVVFRPSYTKSFHLEESISHSTDLIKINWPLLVFCGTLRENYIPVINLVGCNSLFS
ncbi:MAG: hypothetical protein ACKPGB_24400, partial [Dolichospermum sp.]